VDTTNILFICGGAFAGLEEIIRARMDSNSMGFGADVKSRSKLNVTELFSKVRVEDLLKFGMIPEFMGRLPVVVTLSELDDVALVKILSEPRNAIAKQYQRLFAYERVNLVFEPDALMAVAHEALKRKTGARGLRAILEDVMLETMFELPGMKNVKDVIVNAECINDGKSPQYVHFTEDEIAARNEKIAAKATAAPASASTTSRASTAKSTSSKK
jgi:ATP-dependent Clp protease ATP-binding subunit ClpX